MGIVWPPYVVFLVSATLGFHCCIGLVIEHYFMHCSLYDIILQFIFFFPLHEEKHFTFLFIDFSDGLNFLPGCFLSEFGAWVVLLVIQ